MSAEAGFETAGGAQRVKRRRVALDKAAREGSFAPAGRMRLNGTMTMNVMGELDYNLDGATPRLDRVSQDRIGAMLRTTYEAFGKEPIPDQHVDLLLALRRTERERRRNLDGASRF